MLFTYLFYLILFYFLFYFNFLITKTNQKSKKIIKIPNKNQKKNTQNFTKIKKKYNTFNFYFLFIL